MKRFLIHVDTNWCGEEDTFRAVAESEIELWDIAEQLAYDNFYSFGHDQDIAEGEAHIIGTGNVNFFTTQTGF